MNGRHLLICLLGMTLLLMLVDASSAQMQAEVRGIWQVFHQGVLPLVVPSVNFSRTLCVKLVDSERLGQAAELHSCAASVR